MTFRDEGEINAMDKDDKSLIRRRKEARPGELICAARDIFVEKGFAATRIEDVATRAGVSNGTVNLYFDSKEALFRAVIVAGMTPLIETCEAWRALAAEVDLPAAELLRRYLDVWKRINGKATLGRVLNLLAAESGNFPDVVQWFRERVVRDARRSTIRIVESGISSGDFRPVAPDIVADLLFLVLGLRATNDFCDESQPPEYFLEGVLEMLARGLASPPVPGR